MGEKTKEQLLSELLVFQKELEKKVQHQDQMIRRFQMLTANEGLFSQIIDFCPYPSTVFTPQGILEMEVKIPGHTGGKKNHVAILVKEAE